jgi:hypothetical protein
MEQFKKIQFFYYNLVEQPATIITADSENSLFPLTNLKDTRSSKVYRSINDTANVVFDFISAEPVDSILVKGHFKQGVGFNGTLTIKANATNADWSNPAFQTTLVFNPKHNLGYTLLDAAQEYRFWRIEADGSSYVELANIFIGRAFEPSRNIQNGFAFENEDLSTTRRTRYGQKLSDIIADQKIIRGGIRLIEKENLSEFMEFIDYVGEHRPFYVILDPCGCVVDEVGRFAGHFQFPRRPTITHVIRGLYNTGQLRMEENN